MELQSNVAEAIVIKDTIEQQDSWNRERSTEELLGFIAQRELVVLDGSDELF